MGLSRRVNAQLCSVPTGPGNVITDVPGVRVGHVDLVSEGVRTGVTAVVPDGDAFTRKLPAACHVANGFGKSAGLIQIEEMGSLETPILLTNTLSVPRCADALISEALEKHPEIGFTTGTVNPVVLECNDGAISDIRARAVTEADARVAIQRASAHVDEGDVGAGYGMTCFGLKGGIGSSSRVVSLNGARFTLGILTLTNFGVLENLRVAGQDIGLHLLDAESRHAHPVILQENRPDHVSGDARGEHGSIVTVLATDAPLDARQLGRLARRVTVGVSRTGGYIGDGSGEVVVAFSTANRIPHWPTSVLGQRECVHERALDTLFRVVAATTEEAIVSSLLHARTVRGRWGTVHSLTDAAAYYHVPLPVGIAQEDCDV